MTTGKAAQREAGSGTIGITGNYALKKFLFGFICASFFKDQSPE
jgi:hypothetical protein